MENNKKEQLEELKKQKEILKEKKKNAKNTKKQLVGTADKKYEETIKDISEEEKQIDSSIKNLKTTKTFENKMKKNDNISPAEKERKMTLYAAVGTLVVIFIALAGTHHYNKFMKKPVIIPEDPSPIEITQPDQLFDVEAVAKSFMDEVNNANFDMEGYDLEDYTNLILFLNGKLENATMDEYDNVIDMFCNILNQEDTTLINSINVTETPKDVNLINYTQIFQDPTELALIATIQNARQNLLNAIANGTREEAIEQAKVLFEQEVNFVWNVQNGTGISDEAVLFAINLFNHSNNAIISLDNNFSITRQFVNDNNSDESETIYLKDFFGTLAELDTTIQEDIYADCAQNSRGF